MNSSQAYLILNLSPDATYAEVKQAYRKLVLESHPDRNSSEQDGRKFRIVTEAYHLLKKNNRIQNNTQKNTKSNQERAPTRRNWGVNQSGSTPEEDWSRYTKQTEQSDPRFWQEYVAEFWKNYESQRTERRKNPYDF